MVKMLVVMLLLAPAAFAAEALDWQLKPEASTIEWVATQNGAPVKGSFGAYEAEIRFHPDALESSRAIITIDTASIATAYADAQSTLKTADWFGVEAFPKAVFETKSFTKVDDENNFRAESTLTIKDKTVPVTLNFLLHHMHEHEAHIIGEAILKRTDFGIGWADTAQVADEVMVKVEIKASR